MNAILNVGSSSGGNFPDRKTGKEPLKSRTNIEGAPQRKTAVDAQVRQTRIKVAGLGENIDVYA